MPTIAEYVGEYAANLTFEDLPPEVIHQVKRTITDTIGCGFGGYDSEPAKIARDLAGLVSSSQPATLLYGGQRTSVDLAAFANDVPFRYLDFNDGYISKGGGHPSDTIAALLAAAEVNRASGRDLIVATALAYEVYCRIADAWNNKASGIDHTTGGGIASVVGAARLFGLNAQQITHALSIMVTGHVALNQTRMGNISKWKGCAYANANRNAIFAAQLAARGMTGPAQIFEGRNGFFKVVAGKPFELKPFAGKGQPFQILKTHLKQFPLGNWSQTVVTAILEARASIKDVREVAEINIRTTQKALNVMADGPEKWNPRNRETADHSIPYTAALALMYGTIEDSFFEEKYFLHNKELLELVARVKCSASEEANSRDSEFNLCELDVVLRSGEPKSARVEYHRGHPRNPMSDAEVEAKFRSLVGNTLPSARVAALLRQLWRLDDLADVGTLIRMTQIDATG